MQAQDIEVYLADLGQELQDLGVEDPVRIHIQTREQAQLIVDCYIPEKEVQQLSGSG